MTKDIPFEIDLAYQAMVKRFSDGGFAGSFCDRLDRAAEFMAGYLAERGVARKVRWTTAEKVNAGIRVEFEFRPEVEPETRASVFR